MSYIMSVVVIELSVRCLNTGPEDRLITQKRSSTCATKMRERFAYARGRYVAIVDKRHGLAPCNTRNFVV